MLSIGNKVILESGAYFIEIKELNWEFDYSMEVPKGGASIDLESFVEADEKDFREKVDYSRLVFKTKHLYTGNLVDWNFQGPGRYVWVDGTIYQARRK
jgi:hypothetical protein